MAIFFVGLMKGLNRGPMAKEDDLQESHQHDILGECILMIRGIVQQNKRE